MVINTCALYHRYFLNNEDRPLYFTIGVNSGIVRTTKVLDREEKSWHNITVTAAEVGKFTVTANTTLLLITAYKDSSSQIASVSKSAPLTYIYILS